MFRGAFYTLFTNDWKDVPVLCRGDSTARKFQLGVDTSESWLSRADEAELTRVERKRESGALRMRDWSHAQAKE